jgi:hypothetical protein
MALLGLGIDLGIIGIDLGKTLEKLLKYSLLTLIHEIEVFRN